MILLLGGEKGGSGKSCLAQNLAIYLLIKRNRDVLIVDADPQGTTQDWVQERNQSTSLPSLQFVQLSGNIRHNVIDLAQRYQDVVIDAGGHDSEALRSAMTVATHLLMPFRPKRRDLKTLPHCEQLAKMAIAVNPSLQARSVITQAPTLPSQFPRILEAKDACESFSLPPLQAYTAQRNIYDDADEAGSSVIESGTDTKAINEIEAIASEFLCI